MVNSFAAKTTRRRWWHVATLTASLSLFLVGTSSMASGQGAPAPGKGPDPSLVVGPAKSPKLLTPEKNVVPGAIVQRDRDSGLIRRVRGSVPSTDAHGATDAAHQFLLNKAKVLGLSSDLSELTVVREVKSLTGYHVTCQQTYWGLPVFGGQLSVHMDGTLTINLVNIDLVPLSTADKPTLPTVADPAITNAVLAVNAASKPVYAPKAELGVVATDKKPVLVWRVGFDTKSPPGSWVVYVRASDNQVLSIRNNARFADGTGMVYLPDPVSVTGNPNLSDNNNADSPELTAARSLVILKGLDGSGYLQGTYCSTAISDQITRVNQPTLVFDYTRSQTGFDETMAYYHVDRVERYLQSLGFNNVQNRQMGVDVDGVTDDNAWYSPGTGDLTFGTGGVNDVQDAEVIWHENGHAIQDNQVPGWGNTEEGGAMGEGFGDYWAGSQWAGIGPMAPAWDIYLAKWDATAYNPGNPAYLRTLDSTKHYPEDMDFEVHDDGEMWSATLWQIRTLVGMAHTDTMVVEAHFSLSTEAVFQDGAEAILAANQALYGGVNQAAIRHIFVARGFLTADTSVLTAANVTGYVGTNAALSATLKSGTDNSPLAGRTIHFVLASWTQDGTTDASGVATVQYPVAEGTAGAHAYSASFDGEADYLASSATATLTVAKSDTVISVTNTTGIVGGSASLNATLKRQSNNAPLGGRTIHFVLGAQSKDAVTDSTGLASTAMRIPEGSVGGQTITASFAGDTNYNSASGTGTLTVGKSNTTVSVAAVTGSVGSTVTLSATLNRGADGAVLAGRTITFTVGAWSANVVTSSAGVATVSYTVPDGTTGNLSIAASFAGDADYNAGSGVGTLTLAKVDTTLTVPAVAGAVAASVTLSATLTRDSDSKALAGQTVHFAVDTWTQDATTDVNGLATVTYTISDAAAADRTINASFDGNGSYNPTTGSNTLTVTKADTSVSVGNVTGAVGQAVTLSGSLVRLPAVVALAGRTVTFTVGSWSADATTDSHGVATATYTIAEGTVGTGSVTLAFAGDGSYKPSTATGQITVTKGASSLEMSDQSGTVGASVAISATLTSDESMNPLAGRTVHFSIGSWSRDAVTNASGVATVSYAASTGSAGNHTVIATFAGDADYLTSSVDATLTINKAGTSMSTDSVVSMVGGTASLSAVLVNSGDQSPIAGKTVHFVAGSWSGNGTTDSTGTATVSFTVPASMLGDTQFSATFAGDADYQASSATGVLVVAAPPQPADTNRDQKITISEVTAYASAWKKGSSWATGPSPISIDYVTNAGTIWRKGEAYYYDNGQAAPLCWVPGTRASRVAVPTPTISAARSLSSSTYKRGSSLTVTIKVQAGTNVSAWAIEDRVPQGWVVSGLNNGGTFSSSSNTVRWGTFNNTGSTVLTYKVTPSSTSAGSQSFSGVVSANGRHSSVSGSGSVKAK